MDSLLLQDGLKLMLVGMGTVFVFLTLLVGATTAMSALAQRLQPVRPSITTNPRNDESAQVVAAISAAVHLHRAGPDRSQGNSPIPPNTAQKSRAKE